MEEYQNKDKLDVIVVVENEACAEKHEIEFGLGHRNYLCADEPEFETKLKKAVTGSLVFYPSKSPH